MAFVDSRTYFQLEMWQRRGKSYKWLKGYRAGFDGLALPITASEDYVDGYRIGKGDKEREGNPPHIKEGFGYGHGFVPDSQD